MRWWQFALLGAGGGVIVEVLSLFRWCSVWQDARRSSQGTVMDQPPSLSRYIDVPAHVGMLLLRGVLGAVTAVVFAAGGQIQGPYVAVALGFCGPALLGRLGEIPQVSSLISSDPSAARHTSIVGPGAGADSATVGTTAGPVEKTPTEVRP